MFIATITKYWDDYTKHNETFSTEKIEQIFSTMYSFVERSKTGKESFSFGKTYSSCGNRVYCTVNKCLERNGISRYCGDIWLQKIVYRENGKDVIIFEDSKYTSPKLFELCKETLIPLYEAKSKSTYGDF